MHTLRFLTRPPAVIAMALFGLVPLAWKASEAAPNQGTAFSALRAQFALHPHSTVRSHGPLRPRSAAVQPPTAVPLYNFTGQPDGERAQARLIQAGDGNFYGVTEAGGSGGGGGSLSDDARR